MLSKEEALKASKMSLSELQAEYPKMDKVITYIQKHYPDNIDAISSHQMLPGMIFGDYSNTQIEEMIDKLAIFNNWTKYTPNTMGDK